MSFIRSLLGDALNAPLGDARAPHVPGHRYSDGDVQRHIMGMHDGFEDSWRICGDFLCMSVSVADIDDSVYAIDSDTVDEYAALIQDGSLPPVIVLDYEGDFIDGGHRHLAAKVAGSSHVIALIQIENVQEDPDDD